MVLGINRVGIFLSIIAIFSSGRASAWELTFCDEFTGTEINRAVWKFSDLWSNQTLAGNREEQCYLPSAVKISNGVALLRADRKKVNRTRCRGADADLEYSSGMITTAGCSSNDSLRQCSSIGSFSQKYGYFEIRAKLPKGKGLWPAFWLLPIDASYPPEIDIMEAIGQETTKVYFTYYPKNADRLMKEVHSWHDGPDFTNNFSTFGLDWQAGRLAWYVNRNKVYEYSGSEVYNKPMYILINLAVGGKWPGSPESQTVFPADFQIDYVRVFRRTRKTDRVDNLPFATQALCKLH